MTKAIDVLDEIIEIAEAKIPANPRKPKHQRMEKRIAAILRDYFKALQAAIPEAKLARLYRQHVEAISPRAADDFLDPILKILGQKFKAKIAGEIADIYLSGSAEMITWGKTRGGIPIAYEGPPVKQAIAFSKKQGAELVTRMDVETKRRLGRVVADGINKKRGVDGIARTIRTTFADMTKYRSQLIARTETNFALSQAFIDRSKDMKVTHKEWITIGDSEVSEECLANEAAGVIKIDRIFPGGVLAPPQHPNCRCSLAPSMGKT